MYIEDRYLEEIKNRVDLVSLISHYIELKPAGKGFRGLCPFHDEKTPSFHVSPDKEIYHCFGCGVGGNIFNFVMKMENSTFPEAVHFLAERYGVSLPLGMKKDSREQRHKERFFQLNEAAQKHYQWCLERGTSVEVQHARSYLLEKRKLSLEIIRKFGIGFSPTQGKESIQNLLKKGFTGPEIIQGGVGLLNHRRELVDRFRGRIIFTLLDVNETPVGLAGRSLTQAGPKYLNTSDHRYFTKGHLLYGLWTTKSDIRKTGKAILVEGYMDCLALYQQGVINAVASMGTALTKDQATLLKRFASEVVICYDSDKAGKAAAIRAMEMLKEKDLTVQIMLLPEPHDPDSFLQEKGRDAFIEQLKAAKNSFDYTLELLINQYGCTQWDEKIKVVRGIIPFIRSCKDTVEKPLIIHQASHKIGVPESLFYDNQKGMKRSAIQTSLLTESQKSFEPGNVKAEKMLIRAAIEHDELRMLILHTLSPEDFVIREHQRIYQAIKTLSSTGSVSVTKLIDLFSGDELICSIVACLCSFGEGMACKDPPTANELIARVKRVSLGVEIQRLRQELSRTQDIEVLRQLERLIRQENDLKNQKRGEGVL